MVPQHNEHNYWVTDLTWNESFRKWVLDPDPLTNEYWNNWLRLNNDKADAVSLAKKIVLSTIIKEPIVTDSIVKTDIEKILIQIGLNEKSANNSNWPGRILKPRHNLAIAAAVIFISGLVALFYIILPETDGKKQPGAISSTQINHHKLTVYKNNTNQQDTLLLPDGSEILMNPGSTLSYPQTFENKSERKVELEGVAFFKIQRDPAKPFLVYANGLVAKVLGTTFWVRSNKDDTAAIVEVVSGIVSVDLLPGETKLPGKTSAILLTVNQKATYSVIDGSMTSGLVEKPLIIEKPENDFTFNNARIPDVIATVEKAYGVAVAYDEEVFKSRTLTAVLSGLDLYTKMDIICKAIGADYEVIDGKIVLFSIK